MGRRNVFEGPNEKRRQGILKALCDIEATINARIEVT